MKQVLIIKILSCLFIDQVPCLYLSIFIAFNLSVCHTHTLPLSICLVIYSLYLLILFFFLSFSTQLKILHSSVSARSLKLPRSVWSSPMWHSKWTCTKNTRPNWKAVLVSIWTCLTGQSASIRSAASRSPTTTNISNVTSLATGCHDEKKRW